MLERRPRTRLSLAQKLQLIEESSQPGFKRSIACQQYDISTSCISQLLKDKDQILELAKTGVDKNMKSKPMGRNSLLEHILYDWYVIQKKNGLTVTGPMLKAKAKELSNSGEQECSFSNGWLDGFRKRYRVQLTNKKTPISESPNHDTLLEQILYQWVVHQQSCNIIVSGPALKSKAEELSKVCASTSEGYKFSTGWLDSFKKRHGIKFRTNEATGSPSSSGSKVELPDQKPALPLPPPHLAQEWNIHQFK